MGNEGIVGCFLVPAEDGFLLIETGPESTLLTVKAAVGEAGFRLEQLRAILVTHIHLDHAGAAGALAKETGAKVYVHERGYKHLHDPSRLLDSATRIYGDMMDTLWGSITPVPETQLVSLDGGETVKLFGRTIDTLYTPGHASHHLAFLLDEGTLFTGDAAAIRLTGSSVIRPALPPPEINLELLAESAEVMLAAKPKRLMLTHFGEVTDAQAHLQALPKRNQAWADEILLGMKAGETDEELIERISSFGNAELAVDNAPEDVANRHRLTSNYEMTVSGVKRYWEKHHPEVVE